MDALEQSMSVMVRIMSCPPNNGSFMMKSNAIVSNGCAFSAGEMGKSGRYYRLDYGWFLTFGRLHILKYTQ